MGEDIKKIYEKIGLIYGVLGNMQDDIKEIKKTGLTTSIALERADIQLSKNPPKPKKGIKKDKGNCVCVCGHDLNFHSELDNSACHSMDCDCKRYHRRIEEHTRIKS